MENSVTDKKPAISENERAMYLQFKKKINAEAAKAQIKKLEYNLADVTCGLGALRAACADGKALGLGGICVLPSFVRQCAVYLGAERKCQVVACISYPHGGDPTAIKVKSVKQAIKDGADELEVTIPVAQIREGNYPYLRRELKKLRSASKKRALRIDAECSLLTKEEIVKVCAVAADCGVNSVKTSSGVYGRGNELEMVADIKNAVKDKCTVKADGVATVLEMSGALDMGASVIGSKNAADVARSILSAAELD